MILFKKMVLPVRIELTTSALPRMRSTTELRQHGARSGSGAYGRVPRGLSRCTRGHNREAMSEKDDRAARLARQLRENLRKRKARARKEQASATASADRDDRDPPAD